MSKKVVSADYAPYDTMCLFLTDTGRWVEGFIYDGDASDFGYIAYCPLPEIPEWVDKLIKEPEPVDFSPPNVTVPKSEYDRLREALEFYRDMNNYLAPLYSDAVGDDRVGFNFRMTPVHIDGGDIAREALSSTGGKAS